uniref:C-type lectin domain-containing protein n=1 Tax=Strongyloides papillosus TaxID=174720 RepID=A0A0N5BUT9_STREA
MSVNLTDSTKRCAFMNGIWYPNACILKKQFMCQSHKFMDLFDPNLSKGRTLPPVAGYSTYIYDNYSQSNSQAGTLQNMMLAQITSTRSITGDTALANTQIHVLYNGTMYAATNS